jgi:predicted heme/steroid binding protein
MEEGDFDATEMLEEEYMQAHQDFDIIFYVIGTILFLIVLRIAGVHKMDIQGDSSSSSKKKKEGSA